MQKQRARNFLACFLEREAKANLKRLGSAAFQTMLSRTAKTNLQREPQTRKIRENYQTLSLVQLLVHRLQWLINYQGSL